MYTLMATKSWHGLQRGPIACEGDGARKDMVLLRGVLVKKGEIVRYEGNVVAAFGMIVTIVAMLASHG